MKVPHETTLPHNIMGGGEISMCPKECPAHERWLAEQKEKQCECS